MADSKTKSSPQRRRFLKQSLSTVLGVGFLSHASRSPAIASTPASAPPVPDIESLPPLHLTSPLTKSPSRSIADHFESIKSSGDHVALYKFLYALPKGGDIHHHLGGGFLARRWYAIATDQRRNGGQTFYTRCRISRPVEFPLPAPLNRPHLHFWLTLNQAEFDKLSSDQKTDFKPLQDLDDDEREAWISSVKLDRPGEGRDEFFEYIWGRLNNLLFSIHVCSELVVENMQLLGAEGVRYLELMTFYSLWRDEKGTILPASVADQFWRHRLAQPDARATGVLVKFKAVILRFAPDAIERAEQHFVHIDANRDLWVGVDMAGREDDNRGYPRRFTEVFDRMLRKYPEINISIHAGEAEKADRNIFESLRLGAHRIGHAINLLHDEQTMQLMRNNRHLLEINLVSNHLLGYVPDPALHPFPIYLRQGIPCCLNTDDRGMWDSNMTDEYFLAVSQFNLSWTELVQLARNSIEHAFISQSERATISRSYESALETFANSYTRFDPPSLLESTPAETYGYGRKHLGLARLARTLPHSGSL